MKKIFRRSLMTAFASLALVVATACGSSDTSAPAESGDTGADSDAEGTVKYQDAPSTVVIGTASQGGVYYIYGGGLGQLLETKLTLLQTLR